MNRRIRRRQQALSVKAAKAQAKQRRRTAGTSKPAAGRHGAGALGLPNWRQALMATAAATGALAGTAAAQNFASPPSAGDDNLRLTSLPDGDTADALGGADTINVETDIGTNGAATFTGGAGDDSVTFNTAIFVGYNAGAAGQVLGDAGADTIVLDYIFVGYSGAGTISGGADNDSIVIQNDSRIGQHAGSTGQVLGDAGADTITLNQSSVGRSGAGTVSGGADNDSIVLENITFVARDAGSRGQVLGDAGADTITLDRGYVGFQGAGTVDGGEGNDSITLSTSLLGSGAGATGQVLGDAGDDVITLDNSNVGLSGAGTVDGGEGNDSIAMSNNSQIGRFAGSTGQVLGDAGADTITLDRSYVGFDGAGTVDGGAGNDSIQLGNLSAVGLNAGSTGQVLGDAGDDIITLTGGPVGGAGAGTVSGGDGNDNIYIFGSTVGDDVGSTGRVLGGADADTIRMVSGVVGASGDGAISGGDGDDSIELSAASRIGSLSDGTGAVLGDAGNDVMMIENSYVGVTSDATVSGGEGDDSIEVSGFSIVGDGAGVTGSVLGEAGADTIAIDRSVVGDQGAGTVSGGAGNDSIALTRGSDIGLGVGGSGAVLGEAGDDTITLEGGSVGWNGAATVSGGEGDDSLTLTNSARIGVTGAGTGMVLGDAGADTIAVDGVIVGYYAGGTVSGGEGNDSIAISNGAVIGAKAGASGAVLGDAGADTINLTGGKVGYDSGSGVVSGGEGNDSITLGADARVGEFFGSGQILGDAGDDTIAVNGAYVGYYDGSGTVSGGEGDDSITLSDGARVGYIFGSGRILGDAGNDTVSFDQTVVFDPGAVVDGGDGVDELAFTVAEAASMPNAPFQNFEAFRKDGAGTLTVTQALAFDERTSVSEGVLALTGDGALTSRTVDVNGGALATDGGAFAAEAEVSVAASGRLDVEGDETVSRLINDGRVAIAGDARLRAGTISNNAGGVIDVAAGATLEGIGNTLNNAATINVAAGGSLIDAGDINNLAPGVINFNGDGAVSAGGANGFTNAGAVNLHAGDVEIAGDVENAGAIVFAQDGLQTLTINGDYVQTADGALSVSIIGDASDQLAVAGDVELAGELNIASISGVQTGENAIEIINADGAVTGSFDVASGLLIGQDVAIEGGDVDIIVVLNVTVNPVADLTGLSGNQIRVGETLFSLLADPDGDGDLSAIAFAIGLLEERGEIAAAFDDLHPESLDIGLKLLTASQRNFVDQVFEETRHAGPEDGLRLWGGAQASGYNQDRGGEHLSFDGEAYEFSAGVSGYALGRFTLGLAGAYGEYNGDGGGARGDDVDAQIYRVAASARYDLGAEGNGVLGQLSGVVSYAGGETDYEMSRIAGADLATVMQRGSVDVGSFDAAARFTMDGLNAQRWPVSPYAEVGVSAYWQDDAVIGAGGATALALDELSNTRGHAGLGVRYDQQWTARTSAHLRAAGVQYFGDTQNAFTSRFALAGDGAPSFRTHGREINRQVELDASLRHRLESGFAFEATAFGETGDLDIYGARFGVSKSF